MSEKNSSRGQGRRPSGRKPYSKKPSGSKDGFSRGGKKGGFGSSNRRGSSRGGEFDRRGDGRHRDDNNRRDGRTDSGKYGFGGSGRKGRNGNPRYGSDDRRGGGFRKEGGFKSRGKGHFDDRRNDRRNDRGTDRKNNRRDGFKYGRMRDGRDFKDKDFKNKEFKEKEFNSKNTKKSSFETAKPENKHDYDVQNTAREDAGAIENERKGGDRHGFNRRLDRESSKSNYGKGRRNSDGTMSFPSQNPYTDRRHDEPIMPPGLSYSMLSKDDKLRLRGLSKEHSENIGLHILAAYELEEEEPQRALAHARWVARQASRIDLARETLALIAYRQGNYRLAVREFRTAMRMNGFPDYMPFIADCERGLGNPEKAIEIAKSPEASRLTGESKAEMLLVYAGALADLQKWNNAIGVADMLLRAKGMPGEYRMRAAQAEQYFLEQAGRTKDAEKLNPLLDRLEDKYADREIDESELVIDNDLERASDEILEGLGITEADAAYAPDDYFDDEEADYEESGYEKSEKESEESDKDSADKSVEESGESEELEPDDDSSNSESQTAN